MNPLSSNPEIVREELAKAVCLFLAEMLRTRRVTLARGADIAAAVVIKLRTTTSEAQFLELIKEMEYEFQELKHLQADLAFRSRVSERQRVEKLVREFAIHNLPADPERAVVIMEESLKPETTLDSLRERFEDFNQFVSQQD